MQKIHNFTKWNITKLRSNIIAYWAKTNNVFLCLNNAAGAQAFLSGYAAAAPTSRLYGQSVTG